MLIRDCGDSIYTKSALKENREPWEPVGVCVFEKSEVVLSRDCGDAIYTSSALASKLIFIEAVGCSSCGVGTDSSSNKASPRLRNAFVNLSHEVSNLNFYSRGVAVGCSSLGVEIDLYRAMGCSRLGVEIVLSNGSGLFKAWRRNGLLSNPPLD